MLNGLVICAGVVEAVDGDGNRKELEGGKGGIGRDILRYMQLRQGESSGVCSSSFGLQPRYVGRIYPSMCFDPAR